MENKFSNIAKKTTSLSPLMNGREKISVDEIIAKYPEGITVVGFDVVTTGVDTFPVIIFAEDESKFSFGGTVLYNIIEAWMSDSNGVVEDVSNELKAAGGVKMKFEKSRTKTGNNVTLVEIL